MNPSVMVNADPIEGGIGEWNRLTAKAVRLRKVPNIRDLETRFVEALELGPVVDRVFDPVNQCLVVDVRLPEPCQELLVALQVATGEISGPAAPKPPTGGPRPPATGTMLSS